MNLHALKFFYEAAGHRLAGQTVPLSELVREPFIVREEDSATREQLIALCRLHRIDPPEVGLQFKGFNETVRAVTAGYGVSFLSALEVGDYVRRGAVARVYVEGVHETNPIDLFRRSNEELSPAASQFLNFVKSQLNSRQRQYISSAVVR
ncbi:LysR substrate-binding domain-containing protein [Paenibacillus xerothermodurans]|nr:LysR substrate-binding domain-containing protein [Paenibacillus xerothermodurans]